MSNTPLIEIKDLHAEVAGKEILKGLNLTINAGEVHAIMGPNGAGKSTLGNCLSGRDGYVVTSGSVRRGELQELSNRCPAWRFPCHQIREQPCRQQEAHRSGEPAGLDAGVAVGHGEGHRPCCGF